MRKIPYKTDQNNPAVKEYVAAMKRGMTNDTFADVIEAVARGWTHKENENKVMDPTLAKAIAEEVKPLLTEQRRIDAEEFEKMLKDEPIPPDPDFDVVSYDSRISPKNELRAELRQKLERWNS